MRHSLRTSVSDTGAGILTLFATLLRNSTVSVESEYVNTSTVTLSDRELLNVTVTRPMSRTRKDAMKKIRVLGVVTCCFLGIAGGCPGCQREHFPENKSETAALPADSIPLMDQAFTRLDLDTHPETLHLFSVLAPGENTDILDKTLSTLFPDGVTDPGETEILLLLGYVSQTLKLSSSNRHLGSEVLAEGHAYCYGMARAFVALCRRMGMPARINSVHNFEYMQAHNMAEVYYDRNWRLFDPTYGVFFYDKETYDGTGSIPSARALFSGSVPDAHPFMISEFLWTGQYAPGGFPKPLSDDFRYRNAFTLRQLYDRVFSQGFPFVDADNRMASFPILIEMGAATTLSIGAVDGRTEDVEGRQENASYPRYHGEAYLGMGSTGGRFHTISIQAAPARYKITYHFMRGSHFHALDTIELRDIIVEKSMREDTSWSLWFRLQSEEGLFLVVNREGLAVLDAITMDRIE